MRKWVARRLLRLGGRVSEKAAEEFALHCLDGLERRRKLEKLGLLVFRMTEPGDPFKEASIVGSERR